MPRKKPPNAFQERTRHGKMIWVYRIGKGPRTRLPALFGTDEWWEAYNRAAAASRSPLLIKRKPNPSGTFDMAVAQYESDVAVKEDLKASTLKVRVGALRQIAIKNPGMAIEELTADLVEAGLNSRTGHGANGLLRVLRHFCKWAVRVNLLNEDPTADQKKRRGSKSNARPWTNTECSQFELRWPQGTMARVAYEILRTGLRASDAVSFNPSEHDHLICEVQTQKTNAVCFFEFEKRTKNAISATPVCETGVLGTNSPAYLRSEKGTPFASTKTFSQAFAKWCDAAGLPAACRAHGLRRWRATKEAEDLKTDMQLMTRFGWKTIAEAQVYTKSANRKKIALDEVRKNNRKSN